MDKITECSKTVGKDRVTYRVRTECDDAYLVVHHVQADSTYEETIFYTPANGHAVCLLRRKLVWHRMHEVSFMDLIAGRCVSQ